MDYRKPTKLEDKIVKIIGKEEYLKEKLLLYIMLIGCSLVIITKILFDIFLFNVSWGIVRIAIYSILFASLISTFIHFHKQNECVYKKIESSDFQVADMTIKDVIFSRPSKSTYVNLKLKDNKYSIFDKSYFKVFVKDYEIGYIPETNQENIRNDLLNQDCSFVVVNDYTQYAILPNAEVNIRE